MSEWPPFLVSLRAGGLATSRRVERYGSGVARGVTSIRLFGSREDSFEFCRVLASSLFVLQLSPEWSRLVWELVRSESCPVVELKEKKFPNRQDTTCEGTIGSTGSGWWGDSQALQPCQDRP